MCLWGTHLLHMCRLDLLESERIHAFAGKSSVGACVSEKFRHAWDAFKLLVSPRVSGSLYFALGFFGIVRKWPWRIRRGITQNARFWDNRSVTAPTA